MKKLLSILVVGIIALGGLGAAGMTNNKKFNARIMGNSDLVNINVKTIGKSESFTISFSPLIIEEIDNEYAEVRLTDSSTYLMNPGQPMLPKVVKDFELPFGATDINVVVTPNNVQEYEITSEIRPAPLNIPIMADENSISGQCKKVEAVYASSAPFPATWFNYRVGCGLNTANERVTHVPIDIYPVRYVPATGKLYVVESVDITVNYAEPLSNPFPAISEYDLVIIAPSKFSNELQKLVTFKNGKGINTIIKTTESIYTEYSGVDKPEQIKYFIKYAIETWGVKYVLLVGGLKSLIYGKPKDDPNQGTRDWYVPVRYNNIFDNPEHPLDGEITHDPGVISDLYYADIYGEGGVFEDWDPNHDGYFAVWGRPDVDNDTGIDLYPDVSLGRLPCRNKLEVKIMINKIIKYEQNPADPSWFNKMIVVSGDGFLDQMDLDIQWDTNGLIDGEYTIYGKSKNPDGIYGPTDIINVTLDQSVESNITFKHDDHLTTGLKYPFDPVAEITSPSEGNILGNTDLFFSPSGAYCNRFTGWANVNYTDGIMHIRGKSYDPQPYGNLTDIHVWINNSNGETVFSDWRNNTEMYYEGEWTTGEKLLKGGGGALYYMPNDFEGVILWTSNGGLTGQDDVIEKFSEGSGFAFFSGHGNPQLWADHYPGIPGNRGPASVTGLSTYSSSSPPFFPMERLLNINKPSMVVVGGCHNSQFNVSLLETLRDKNNSRYMWCYGKPAPECWSEWIIRLSGRGGIASIGNTGLGYGVMGKDCTIGGCDNGLTIEFFRQYGTEDHDILGEAFSQAITRYINIFGNVNQDHVKTIEQWVLLGDPSLKLGGYSSGGGGLNIDINCAVADSFSITGQTVTFNGMASEGMGKYNFKWDFDNDGVYDDANGQTVAREWDQPGTYVVGLKVTDSTGKIGTYDTTVNIEPLVYLPELPEGSTNVNQGITYTYTTSAGDNDAYWNNVYYKYDWGDGTEGDWLGPYAHNEEVSANHRWNKEGRCAVKVIALLTHDATNDNDVENFKFTDWSPSLDLYVNHINNQNSQHSLHSLYLQVVRTLASRLLITS